MKEIVLHRKNYKKYSVLAETNKRC